MERQVKCECGYVARGATDEEVVRQVRDHLRSDHPDLHAKVLDDQIREWIEVIA
jgi:predicted small metal-binding protein